MPKEGQLQGLSYKRKRLDGAGRKLSSLELDNEVYEWIIAQRRLKLPISWRSIQVRARGLALDKNVNDFTASNGWLQKFLARHGLSLRRVTTACQKAPAELVERLSDFFLFVRRLLSTNNYPDSAIYGADECGVWLDGQTHTTVEVKGAK